MLESGAASVAGSMTRCDMWQCLALKTCGLLQYYPLITRIKPWLMAITSSLNGTSLQIVRREIDTVFQQTG